MIARAVLCAAAIWALAMPGDAQTDPEAAARAALIQMEAAEQSLRDADGARDRVRALTLTIRAHETGLAALRDGLRRAAARETHLTRQLESREAEIARFLGVLQTIETTPAPVTLVHPTGPIGTARSAMLLADITPTLQARADTLRGDLEAVKTLQALQQEAVLTLESGLAGIQQARSDLSQAIASRDPLPRRFTEDPVRTAILQSSSETLSDFANNLSRLSADPIAPLEVDVSAGKGQLDLPVQGVILRKAGEADAAGITRDGVVLATHPRALVTSPTAATIRYIGPLLDLGNVMILEPQPDTLFVLSGLNEVFGEPGEVIPADTPVGLMGGDSAEIGAILSLSGDGTGTGRSETLYMEVRESGRPVDPETWFRTDKDG